MSAVDSGRFMFTINSENMVSAFTTASWFGVPLLEGMKFTLLGVDEAAVRSSTFFKCPFVSQWRHEVYTARGGWSCFEKLYFLQVPFRFTMTADVKLAGRSDRNVFAAVFCRKHMFFPVWMALFPVAGNTCPDILVPFSSIEGRHFRKRRDV